MSKDTDRSIEIQKITGLQPKHFADLVRVAQLVDDPAGGLTGRLIQVNWDAFGISPSVVENLKALGEKYRYSSPYVAIAQIWEQLTPETRSWFIAHKNLLWHIEEILPALDED
ncbi:hypothetical protein HC931_16465 [Candidatus Gracilibacteria bacterium]|nr:hypothetical protein [Candidatus Gracilibacteria bacterium]NJM87955.1 hypothetical protein [Hydrococcus sp. RU_2_2]NJP21197.1 hypothetical protein [Hydrococcus sp. CRU_1_1]NJQ98252.1 hypothetical protein [Hydrococcus sp. CSU_1_8]